MDAAARFPWCLRQLLDGKTLVIPSTEHAPAEAEVDRRSWRHFGVKSVIDLPLAVGGRAPLGVLNFSTAHGKRSWPEPVVKQLELVARVITGALVRQREEQALPESEDRLRMAAESANIGLWSLDLASQLFWLTPMTRELFGFSPAESVSWQRVLEAIHPEDRGNVERALQAVVQTRKEGQVEYRVPQTDGRLRWFISRGRLRQDRLLGSQCVMGVTADITERKLAELALREREVRLEEATDVAALGFYEMLIPLRQEYFDARIQSILGFPNDLVSGFRDFWEEHLHPADRDWVLDISRQVLGGSLSGVTAEYRYLHPQRGVVWLRQAARVFERDAQGRTMRILGVMQDITESKVNEEKLRQAFHALEQSPVLVVITNAQGQITYVNRKFTEVSGYSQAECLGQNPRFLKSGETPPEIYRELWACITGGGTWRGEFHNRKKNGELYWEAAIISPLHDSAGQITHFVAVKEDITDRKRAALESYRDRAEITHLSRVAMLGEMSGSLAHELNQPLTAILSNAQAAQRFLADGQADLNEVREILRDIVADDLRAGEVIRRLRLLLKKGEVHSLPLDLNEVVQDVLKMVRNDLLNHSITLQTAFAPDLPAIHGDRVQLQQVMLNLILNATDAMATNAYADRQLAVQTERTPAGAVRISIRDRGHGLTPEAQARIFQPFFTTKLTGMGLGLKVCRTIITAHGGQLGGENNPDAGATFYFELPAGNGTRSEQ
ncbi:MAG: Adaptive-response sensory-kinase SasA [Verrucomicrobiae bacterium]|nr:Adaptive-response sensory-kinase SasA [Verrucomicrobiae bacterium]